VAYELRLGEVDEEWLVGFHLVERWGEDAFRWSGPVALVRLGLPAGTYEVRLETRGVRVEPLPLCLEVFFNRHKVPSSSIQFDNGLLSFRVLPSMFEDGPEQRLFLTCNPLRPWKVGMSDRRTLGLPIFPITFTRAQLEASGHDQVEFSIFRHAGVTPEKP
jgi:hypothetical protein